MLNCPNPLEIVARRLDRRVVSRRMESPPQANFRATEPASLGAVGCLMLLAAAGIPVSLLWDFSWESTVGIDRVWAPAHVITYLAVCLAALASVGAMIVSSQNSTKLGTGVQFWK